MTRAESTKPTAAERLRAFARELPILRPVLYGRGETPVSRYGMAAHDRRQDEREHAS